MKKHLLLPLGSFAVIIWMFSGCADSSSSVDKLGEVTVKAQMENSTVSSSFDLKKPSAAAGPTCDSVVVQRVRFLISELKLHRDDKDSTNSRRKIKAGVFILEFTPGDAKLIAHNNGILTGTYDKLKFEMHRLKDKEDSIYVVDPLFSDFLKGGYRFTCIINGLVYNSGNGTPFEVLSDRNENVTMHLDPPIEISQTVPSTLFMSFDPQVCFIKSNGKTLDPRYPENQNEIEKLIKVALKALRR